MALGTVKQSRPGDSQLTFPFFVLFFCLLPLKRLGDFIKWTLLFYYLLQHKVYVMSSLGVPLFQVVRSSLTAPGSRPSKPRTLSTNRKHCQGWVSARSVTLPSISVVAGRAICTLLLCIPRDKKHFGKQFDQSLEHMKAQLNSNVCVLSRGGCVYLIHSNHIAVLTAFTDLFVTKHSSYAMSTLLYSCHFRLLSPADWLLMAIVRRLVRKRQLQTGNAGAARWNTVRSNLHRKETSVLTSSIPVIQVRNRRRAQLPPTLDCSFLWPTCKVFHLNVSNEPSKRLSSSFKFCIWII